MGNEAFVRIELELDAQGVCLKHIDRVRGSVVKAIRRINRSQPARVLEIGGGRELALAPDLNRQRPIPESYIGIDGWAINQHGSLRFPVAIYGRTDVADANLVGFDTDMIFIKNHAHRLPNVFVVSGISKKFARPLRKVFAMMKAAAMAGQRPVLFLPSHRYLERFL